MFDTIGGLPVHALVVHGVVVLLPLAVLGTIAIAVRPVWRRTFGPVVLAITAIATALVPVATRSGNKLAGRVGVPEHHKRLGEQLIWFALPLLVLVLVLVVLDRRTTTASADSPAHASGGLVSAVNVVAVLSVVAAVAAGVWVYRVGDAGSRAVWEDIVKNTQPQ